MTEEAPKKRPAPAPELVKSWQHGLKTRRGWRRAADTRAQADREQADGEDEQS